MKRKQAKYQKKNAIKQATATYDEALTAFADATRRQGLEMICPANTGTGTTGLDKPDAQGCNP